MTCIIFATLHFISPAPLPYSFHHTRRGSNCHSVVGGTTSICPLKIISAWIHSKFCTTRDGTQFRSYSWVTQSYHTKKSLTQLIVLCSILLSQETLGSATRRFVSCNICCSRSSILYFWKYKKILLGKRIIMLQKNNTTKLPRSSWVIGGGNCCYVLFHIWSTK